MFEEVVFGYGMVPHTYNPIIGVAERNKPWVEGYPRLHKWIPAHPIEGWDLISKLQKQNK